MSTANIQFWKGLPHGGVQEELEIPEEKYSKVRLAPSPGPETASGSSAEVSAAQDKHKP